MGAWSIFRRVRICIFALISIVSLLLTIVFSIFLVKDFSHYNALQRATIIGLAVVNGVASILMYLMIVVHYSTKLDALRIFVLLLIQAGGTALFTLHIKDRPCNSFSGGATCTRLSFYTAIISWALCGLLVLYGACLAVMSCIPQPRPVAAKEFTLDDDMSIHSKSRHRRPSSMDSQAPLVSPDLEKQLFSMREASPTQWVNKPRQALPNARQQVLHVQTGATGYSAPYAPFTPIADTPHSVYSSTSMFGRGHPQAQSDSPYSAHGTVRRMQPQDNRWPSPQIGPYQDPIPRAHTETPSSIFSSSTAESSVIFAGGPYLPPPPPSAQSRPQPRRTGSSRVIQQSPAPSVGSRRADGQQLMRTPTSASVGSDQWKQLVLDAASSGRH